jgi:hypothetical protein
VRNYVCVSAYTDARMAVVKKEDVDRKIESMLLSFLSITPGTADMSVNPADRQDGNI